MDQRLLKIISSYLVFVPGFILFALSAQADTIHLKNGNTLEGFVEKETSDSVDFNLGFGSVTLLKTEIAQMIKSDPQTSQKLWDSWNQRKKEEELRRPQEEEDRRLREAEAERTQKEEEAIKEAQEEYGSHEVRADTEGGHFFVHVLLNGKVRLKLLLDSGASAVVLPKRVADQLEIDISQLKKISARMADGHVADVGQSSLESLEILSADEDHPEDLKTTGVKTENVETFFLTRADDVILETLDKVYRPDDGLLGMSFLKHFKLKLDYENKKIIFIKNQAA